MSEKKEKSTFQAKVLTVVLLVLFIGSCACIIYAGISWNSNKGGGSTTDGTEPSQQATTQATLPTELSEPESSFVAETTVPVKTDLLAQEYVMESVRDTEGNQIALNSMFGNSFTKGVITFDENRFNIVTDGNGYSWSGTYTALSDTDILFVYDNSYEHKATIITLDESVITSFELPLSEGEEIITFTLG